MNIYQTKQDLSTKLEQIILDKTNIIYKIMDQNVFFFFECVIGIYRFKTKYIGTVEFKPLSAAVMKKMSGSKTN